MAVSLNQQIFSKSYRFESVGGKNCSSDQGVETTRRVVSTPNDW
ncbi:hypothetical protein [Calothrix sp. NIES-3974]|nr:hypothetical protein [Calothrix sp. NIES-3974]